MLTTSPSARPPASSKTTLITLPINDILSVPGIDLITFGPQDLAQSMGHPGRPNHPEVLDAMKKVKEAVHARGRLMSEDVESGINFVQWVPSKLADWLEEKKSGK